MNTGQGKGGGDKHIKIPLPCVQPFGREGPL